MVGDQMHIHESSENYLEAILALSEKGPVRSIDVAQHLSFSKPSVSRAMSLLRENGYVVMDQDGFLTLTDAGMEIASRIYERHLLLTKWLTQLGVPEDIAAQDACKIEHDLSVESFEAIRNHINKH
jgi:Mn-dependent DtxR family transcriptional regulator